MCDNRMFINGEREMKVMVDIISKLISIAKCWSLMYGIMEIENTNLMARELNGNPHQLTGSSSILMVLEKRRDQWGGGGDC